MSIRIIIDSTCDMKQETKEKFTVVPLTLNFGEEEYIDGVTIDHKTFYEKLIESDVLPTTSQATPAAFADVFESVKEIKENGTVVGEVSGEPYTAIIADLVGSEWICCTKVAGQDITLCESGNVSVRRIKGQRGAKRKVMVAVQGAEVKSSLG